MVVGAPPGTSRSKRRPFSGSPSTPVDWARTAPPPRHQSSLQIARLWIASRSERSFIVDSLDESLRFDRDYIIVGTARRTWGMLPACPLSGPVSWKLTARGSRMHAASEFGVAMKSRSAGWTTWSVLVLTWCGLGSAEDRLWLVRDAAASATIIRGAEDDFAAERLQGWLAEKTGAQIEVRSTDREPPAGKGCVVLIGSLASNPLLRRIAGQLKLELDPQELTDQGYVARRVYHEGRHWLILAGGGRDGAIHAVVDLVHWSLGAERKACGSIRSTSARSPGSAIAGSGRGTIAWTGAVGGRPSREWAAASTKRSRTHSWSTTSGASTTWPTTSSTA